MGYVGDVPVRVRAALLASGRGEAVWRAGRRGGAVRLRDVTLGRGAGRGCMNSVGDKHLTADGVGGLSSVWAVASERDSGWGDAVVDAAVGAGAGRRRYVVGARWHEGALVMMTQQMRNPALLWRYGDG